MVAKSADFVPYLLNAQRSQVIRDALGTDIMGSEKALYNVNLINLSLISMVMKVVQDLHPTVATDAAWQTRLNSAVDMTGGWPGWILGQIRTEDLATYGATTSDTLEQLQQKIRDYDLAHP
jgi:hypothetical protein